MIRIKKEYTDQEDSFVPNHSTMGIKEELEPIDEDDPTTSSDSSVNIKLEYDAMEAEPDNDAKAITEGEWNPNEEIQIKDEITIEEAKLELCSEFRRHKLQFSCKFCDFSCVSSNALRNHCEIVHTDERTVRCGICYLSFRGIEKYEEHIEEKHQGFELQCKICLAQYTKDQATQHRSECPGQLLFSCIICDKSFVKNEGILRHLDEHRIPEDDRGMWISEVREKEQFFSCAICEDDQAYAKDLYWKHIEEQHNLCCPNCRKTFKTPNDYNKHLKYTNCKSKLNEKILTEDEIAAKSEQEKLKFSCKHCDFRSASGRSLKVHIQALHEVKVQECSESKQSERQYTCRLCDFSSTSPKALQIHIEVVHTEDRTARCCICHRSFKGTTKLEKHIEDEHQGFEMECKICLKLYKRGQWSVHKVECLGRLLFACGSCGKIFLKKEGLLRHLDEHGISEDRKDSLIIESRRNEQFFSCVICEDDTAFTKDPYWKHVEEQHNGHHLRCPDCGKTFRMRNDHYMHVSKLCKVGAARERFIKQKSECQHCSKVYPNTASLEAHIARIHTNKPSKCSFCKKEFPTVGAMHYHRNKEHITPNLSCSHCDRKFHDQYKLRRHEASHQPLVCRPCGLTFETQIYLANHIRLQHLKRNNTKKKSAKKTTKKTDDQVKHEKVEPQKHTRSGRSVKRAPIKSAHGEDGL